MTVATLTSAEIAGQGRIYLATVGSTAHGLNLPGTNDLDQLGICIEPADYVIGLKSFEQHVFRSKPQGVRSEPGDLDLTIYSLRKFCRLALSGNPSILVMLYAPEYDACAVGEVLRENAHWFSARSAGKAFLGYMTQQRQRLLGERGQMNVNRPELVEKHGWDVKYGFQMLRLGYQGVEFLETGALTLPMPEPERTFLYQVRTGNVSLNAALTRAGELERRVENLLDTSPLPAKPDYEAVNNFLVTAYLDWWNR